MNVEYTEPMRCIQFDGDTKIFDGLRWSKTEYIRAGTEPVYEVEGLHIEPGNWLCRNELGIFICTDEQWRKYNG